MKILEGDILYIEALANYLKIHLPPGSPVIARMTMKSILEKLSSDFIRVHRSLYPMSRVEGVRNKIISVLWIENSHWHQLPERF